MRKDNKWLLFSTLAVLVVLIVLAFMPVRAQTPPQVTNVLNQLGINQLPKCPAAAVGTTFVYYTTITSVTPLRQFTGCATLGPGLLLLNGPTGLPQISAPGPSTTTSVQFTYGEIPVGAIDGTNTTYTLAAAPNPPASIEVFRNIGRAVLCTAQTTTCDFTLTGNAITFLTAPQAGDLLMAAYRTQ